MSSINTIGTPELDIMGWQDSLPGALQVLKNATTKLEHVIALGNRVESVPPEIEKAFDGCYRSPEDITRSVNYPICRKSTWPNDAPFAIFLSTDIDQIHDREIFRWLGDVNHLRRHWFKGEQGRTWPCMKRIIRPLMRPIDPMRQFKAIRRIQGKHGWKSTFYLLEDIKWARLGGRFHWDDPAFEKISHFLLEEECELGIHGSAYSHKDVTWWKNKSERFERLYGMPPAGARNHYLSLSVPETWRAQEEAGLKYDSTFGYPNQLGAPGGFCFPFTVPNTQLIELPLTVMDVTLFRYLGLDGEQSLATAKEVIEKVISLGGLVSILWHNNFFDEEEYSDWEVTYTELLNWIAKQTPWNGTGADISKWWNARNALEIATLQDSTEKHAWQVHAGEEINDLVIEIHNIDPGASIACQNRPEVISRKNNVTKLHFDHIDQGQEFTFSVSATN